MNFGQWKSKKVDAIQTIIQKLEKNYTRNEPEQFLAMYDAIRENSKDKK